MDIIIFRNNEITPLHFKDQIVSKILLGGIKKNSKYGNYEDLDISKSKIDRLDKRSEFNRRISAKYLHEYELIKLICKKQVISRAYFKLYEIIYHESLILEETLDCFFICESPGGFIECISDIRRKKNLRMKYITISKLDRLIKYDRYLEESNLLYGDITNIKTINETILNVTTRFPSGLNLITADGGFDVKVFNDQEIITSKLLLCEIYLALNTQRINGMFIIKFFDMFTHNSIMYYMILCLFYKYVKIIKPNSSRNCNSERYLVCYNFTGLNNTNLFIIRDIYRLIQRFTIDTVIYPDFKLDHFKNFYKNMSTFNNLILYEQVKTINESIKMINNKDLYFQNLLLKLFADKVPLNYVYIYKNILYSRIKKCICFLRRYNINITQIIYNFNEL
jgi:23S rRNA U2552 (ribose-2'-O)-methylase RlmE/FtsJ